MRLIKSNRTIGEIMPLSRLNKFRAKAVKDINDLEAAFHFVQRTQRLEMFRECTACLNS